MRNGLMTALAVVAAATAAMSANAATVVFDGNYGSFGAQYNGAVSFTNTWSFELPADGLLSGGLVSANVSALQGITFSSVTFQGQALDFFRVGSNQYFDLPETFLSAGTYDLLVSGSTGASGGRYSGEFAFFPSSVGGNPGGVPGAVPEPISWAMMVGGFGFVGGALRSQRRQKVAVNFG
jgi:hypothetical protein